MPRTLESLKERKIVQRYGIIGFKQGEAFNFLIVETTIRDGGRLSTRELMRYLLIYSNALQQ